MELQVDKTGSSTSLKDAEFIEVDISKIKSYLALSKEILIRMEKKEYKKAKRENRSYFSRAYLIT